MFLRDTEAAQMRVACDLKATPLEYLAASQIKAIIATK